MQETSYADVNPLPESLLFNIRGVLRQKLVGLYMFGSLTTSDFDPGSSDIDLLAATSADISDTESEALRAMHQDFSRRNPEWDDRIDVAYLSVTALNNFRSVRSPIAVISPGEPFHMKDAGKEWLQSWYAVREDSVALFGPPAKTIIGPITLDEFTQCIRDYTVELTERLKAPRKRKGQAYEILTMCRALYLVRKGQRVSKKKAAQWAQEEVPGWSWLIQSALAWREAWREDKVDHAATQADTVRFVSFVSDRILG